MEKGVNMEFFTEHTTLIWSALGTFVFMGYLYYSSKDKYPYKQSPMTMFFDILDDLIYFVRK